MGKAVQQSGLVALMFCFGCNLLTGADNLELAGETVATGGGGEGTGGEGGATVGPTGSGAGPTGSTTSGPGPGPGPTGSGGTTVASTGVTTSASECEYPSGPYGIQPGQRLDPSMTWQGYRANGNSVETISIEDLFDCDGSHNVHAVLIIGAQTTCGPCQAEAEEISSHLTGWAQDGIHVLTLMLPSGAAPWRNAFGLQASNVADDPTGSILVPGGNGTPINIIWDPRTGLVVDRWNGYGAGYSALESLAAENEGGS